MLSNLTKVTELVGGRGRTPAHTCTALLCVMPERAEEVPFL